MGHVTALGATPDEALARAREAAGHIGWAPAGLVTAERCDGRPLVGVVGGSRSDFPVLEQAIALLDVLERPERAAGRVRASQPGPPVPLRRDGAGAGASG